MKARIGSSVLLLLGIGTLLGLRAQGRTSDEAMVRSLDDQERTAALKRDIPALERLWSDQLTVNAPNNVVLIGKGAVLALVHRGVINFSSFERTIEFIRVDSDLGIIMGAETVRPIGDAPSYRLLAGQAVHRRFTNLWRKEGSTWRMIARHANVIPPP